MRTGLTVIQRDSLKQLTRGRQSTGQVAQGLDRDNRSTFSALSALERKGMIARSQDVDDGWVWGLTDRGWSRAQR